MSAETRLPSSTLLGSVCDVTLSPEQLLAAYDDQLRTAAETQGALSVTRIGPLHLASFTRSLGFITYRDLGEDVDAAGVRELVTRATQHFRDVEPMRDVEWKSRGHDHAPGLAEALAEHGYVAEDPESIMVGEAQLLAVDVALPDGVTLRTVTEEADVLRMCTMQGEVFGDPPERAAVMAAEVLRRLDEMELWVAEAHGEVVSAGRMHPVPGSEFAGLWGGATRPEWRGRGIYRALTAARARSALTAGKTLMNSDSTEFSRPILERSGFLKLSTTTPYRWTRPDA